MTEKRQNLYIEQVPSFSFFFSCLLPDSFGSNFFFLYLGPCVKHSYFSFRACVDIFKFFFSALGVPQFFSCLWSWVFVFVVTFFVLRPCVKHFFLLSGTCVNIFSSFFFSWGAAFLFCLWSWFFFFLMFLLCSLSWSHLNNSCKNWFLWVLAAPNRLKYHGSISSFFLSSTRFIPAFHF